LSPTGSGDSLGHRGASASRIASSNGSSSPSGALGSSKAAERKAAAGSMSPLKDKFKNFTAGLIPAAGGSGFGQTGTAGKGGSMGGPAPQSPSGLPPIGRDKGVRK
jgi:hypothetical protein